LTLPSTSWSSAPSLKKLAASRLAAAKKAAEQARLTEGTTITEFRERYAAPDRFLAFCDLLEIKPLGALTTSGRVPFKLSPIQRAFCDARTGRDVILKPRQVWITSVELARDIWYWLTKPGSNVVVMCQSSTDHDMSNRLSERIAVYLESLAKNAGLKLDFKTETKTLWILEDGSALQVIEAGASAAAAQKKGRGDTVHRLHTTELAFWEQAGLSLNAILEAIAGPEHGTEIVHESTANGAGGERPESSKDTAGGPYFYWLCQDARSRRNGYKFHFIQWMEHPEYRVALEPGEVITPEQQPDRARRAREEQAVARGATPEQLKWLRGKLGSKSIDDVDQEYPSDPDRCFLSSGRKFFDKDATDKLFAGCCEPLRQTKIQRLGAVGTLKVWHEPEPGNSYVIPVDTSGGEGGDRGGGEVYERGSGKHCATLVGQFKPAELAAELAALGYAYNTSNIAVERNNHGHAVIQELQRASHGEEPTKATGAAQLWPKKESRDTEKKRPYPNLFTDVDNKVGWNSVEVRRTPAVDALEQAHRSGAWTTRDREIVAEINTFIVTKDGKAEAQRGARDDLVMMAVIGWDVLRRPETRMPIGPPPAAPSIYRYTDSEESGSRYGGRSAF
jgi:hypothetical protein